WSSRSSRPRLERGASDRASPMTACVSSRSPSASIRGSVFRTRALPKSDVSPRSPVRVATLAEGRRGRAGTPDSLAAPVTLRELPEQSEGASDAFDRSARSAVQSRYARPVPRSFPRGLLEGPMPSGRGDAKDKNKKKKSKEQLEKELKRKGVAQPVQPMTFEIVKPKRKEKENW